MDGSYRYNAKQDTGKRARTGNDGDTSRYGKGREDKHIEHDGTQQHYAKMPPHERLNTLAIELIEPSNSTGFDIRGFMKENKITQSEYNSWKEQSEDYKSYFTQYQRNKLDKEMENSFIK